MFHVKHNMNIRVYYEDTDAGGIVYHANYLKFAERGRTEFLRHLGFENRKLNDDFGVIFVVRHIDIDYLKTAHLDDELQLETTIMEIKNSSFIMHQRTLNAEEIIADMRVVLVCVENENYTPVRLPKKVKEAFHSYQENV